MRQEIHQNPQSARIQLCSNKELYIQYFECIICFKLALEILEQPEKLQWWKRPWKLSGGTMLGHLWMIPWIQLYLLWAMSTQLLSPPPHVSNSRELHKLKQAQSSSLQPESWKKSINLVYDFRYKKKKKKLHQQAAENKKVREQWDHSHRPMIGGISASLA